jgi:hypothetical protein
MLDNPRFEPRYREREFTFSTPVPTAPGTNSVSCTIGTAILSGGQEFEAWFEQPPPPPPSVDVKNDYGCTTTPVRACIARYRETFTFIWPLHENTEESREESQDGRCQRKYEQDTLQYKLHDLLFSPY